MTNYNFSKESSLEQVTKEVKAKRKKVLEGVYERRRRIYKRKG